MITDKQELPLPTPIGEIDWWLRGELTRLFISGKFKADEGEILYFTSDKFCKNKNYLLFGVDNVRDFDIGKGKLMLLKLNNQLTSLNIKHFLLVLSKNLSTNTTVIKKYLKNFSFDTYL